MKKVFLDTNVIADYVLNRDGADAAEEIMFRHTDKMICASLLTMANVAYLCRKGRTRMQLYETMARLSLFIHTLPMDELQFKATIAQPVSDFEDMLQYQCAIANDCDIIVTRNTKHFQFSQLPFYTSEAFVDSFPAANEKTK